MDKLKSCPFCGGKAVIRRTPGYDGQFYVRCMNFNICYVMPTTETFKTKIEAINAWNRRNGGTP